MKKDLSVLPTFVVHLERNASHKKSSGGLLPGTSHMVVVQAHNEALAVKMALTNTQMDIKDRDVKISVNPVGKL